MRWPTTPCALEAALRRAMAVEDRPSLIVLRSHIGWPSPHQTDTAEAHGDPFGEEEIRHTKEILGLPPDETFWVPDEVVDLYRRCVARGGRCGDGVGGPASARVRATGRPGTPPGPAAASTVGRPSCPPSRPGRQLATRRAINACLNATAD